MKSHWKTVVWPKGKLEQDKKPDVYRYILIGMLITEKPIEALEGLNERVVEGDGTEVILALESNKKRKPNVRLGDATDVLLNFDLA